MKTVQMWRILTHTLKIARKVTGEKKRVFKATNGQLSYPVSVSNAQ